MDAELNDDRRGSISVAYAVPLPLPASYRLTSSLADSRVVSGVSYAKAVDEPGRLQQ
jgi:hypothetical protein